MLHMGYNRKLNQCTQGLFLANNVFISNQLIHWTDQNHNRILTLICNYLYMPTNNMASSGSLSLYKRLREDTRYMVICMKHPMWLNPILTILYAYKCQEDNCHMYAHSSLGSKPSSSCHESTLEVLGICTQSKNDNPCKKNKLRNIKANSSDKSEQQYNSGIVVRLMHACMRPLHISHT